MTLIYIYKRQDHTTSLCCDDHFHVVDIKRFIVNLLHRSLSLSFVQSTRTIPNMFGLTWAVTWTCIRASKLLLHCDLLGTVLSAFSSAKSCPADVTARLERVRRLAPRALPPRTSKCLPEARRGVFASRPTIGLLYPTILTNPYHVLPANTPPCWQHQRHVVISA